MPAKQQNMPAAHEQANPLPFGMPTWGHRWLLLGMWWFLVGMAASPVGRKVWNPGKPYHMSLLVLFVVPALWMAWRHRVELARRMVGTIEGVLLLIFLGWATLSVAWASRGHLGDTLIVVIYACLFVTTWAAVVAGNPQGLQRLLFWAGIGLGASALLAMLAFPWRELASINWQDEARLAGFGTLNNPNLAGYAYGAALVWLLQVTMRGRALHLLHTFAVVMLSVFIVLTFSRATWLAVLLSQACMLLSVRQGNIRWRACALLALAVAAIGLGGWHYLEERGLSYRPQILAQAWDLIRAHPWRGLGLGSRYTIQVDDNVWMHSHNVFTHLAIILGVPAAILWLALWLVVGWRGWQFRHVSTGRCLLSWWVFATVAWQFDAPHLLAKPQVEWILGWLPLGISMGLAWRLRGSAEHPMPSAAAAD